MGSFPRLNDKTGRPSGLIIRAVWEIAPTFYIKNCSILVVLDSFRQKKINLSPLRPVNNSKEDIAIMILNYLRKNPDAGDTLEGISKWWLNREMIESSVDDVSGVIEKLIKEGKIQRQVTSEKKAIYKLSNRQSKI